MSEQKGKRAGKRSVVCKCQALWKSSVSEWHGLRPPALYSPIPLLCRWLQSPHTLETHILSNTHTQWNEGVPVTQPCHSHTTAEGRERKSSHCMSEMLHWLMSRLAHVSTGPCLFYPGFPYLMTPTHLTPLPLIMSQYIFKCYTMTFGHSPSYRLRPFQNGTFVTVAQQRPKCTENIQKSHWHNKHTETVTKSTWNNTLLKATGLISGVWFQNKNVYHVCMVPPKVPRELFHSYACLQQCMQFQARHRYGVLLIHIFSSQRL
jgi:hypothetical protein